MENSTHDLIVLGAGPGGYTAAVRAARLGMKTALVESSDAPGGVCLNWGCIPTKALLHSAALWRQLRGLRREGITVGDAGFDYAAIQRRSRQVVARLVKGLELLFRDAGVELLRGAGRLEGRAAGGIQVAVGAPTATALCAPHVIVATGGQPRRLPGIEIDGERVLGSRDALRLEEVPPRLLIVGAGAIGLEFADLFATFGSRVTVVEMLPHILPGEDSEVSRALRAALVKRGIRIVTGAVVAGIEKGGDGLHCRIAPAADGPDSIEPTTLDVDRVLLAVGVTGRVAGLGLERWGVAARRGFLEVDGHLRCAAAGLYAVGDVTGPPLLAHAAAAAGIHAAEHAAGIDLPAFDAALIPGAVFTAPQVASVGLREDDLAPGAEAVRVGRFPFAASGKAVAEGDVVGFVKVLIGAADGRLLGAHVVGHLASELIGELGLAVQAGLPAADVMRAVHTHPTLSEAIPEAVAAALGAAIHG